MFTSYLWIFLKKNSPFDILWSKMKIVIVFMGKCCRTKNENANQFWWLENGVWFRKTSSESNNRFMSVPVKKTAIRIWRSSVQVGVKVCVKKFIRCISRINYSLIFFFSRNENQFLFSKPYIQPIVNVLGDPKGPIRDVALQILVGKAVGK